VTAGATPRTSGGALTLRIVVLAYVGTLLILPFAAVLHAGFGHGLHGIWAAVTAPSARDAILLSLWTATAIALLNAVAGTATAWVLQRYPMPGKKWLSTLVDLPFAIPTLVAGVMLVLLFGPARPVGGWLEAHGIKVLFATPVILLALAFITVPLVVRAVEPVLAELDTAEEEAAATLGAGPTRTFWKVVLPALVPAIASGSLQSFARSLAEFGSIVVVSGNIPHKTLTGSVYIFSEVESGRPEVAAAASLVLLGAAVIASLAARTLSRRLVTSAHAPEAIGA
jgi:sulfate/thiosulfate transport system permease protein